MGVIYRNNMMFGANPNSFGIGVGGGYAPIGTIISYMGTIAPYDYLICDGATYNIADWPQLADHFNAQFGSKNFFGGNGTTTFAVPDLRGEFLRGTGSNGYADQGDGASVGTHQNATKIPNVNAIETSTYKHIEVPLGGSVSYFDKTSSVATVLYADNCLKYTHTSAIYASGTVRPTNTSVLYCIKARVFTDELHYSLEEQQIGYWIDGKPLYQKTIQPNFKITANGALFDLSTDFPNVDTVFVCSEHSWLINGDDTASLQPLSFSPPNTATFGSTFLLITDSGVKKLRFYIGSSAANQFTLQILTLQYTKTTD